MAKPVIGVSCGKRFLASAAKTVQDVVVGVDIDYVDGVLRAGGSPILLPSNSPGDAVEALIPRLDGLILTGGGDVVSLNYGQEAHPNSLYQDPARDTAELVSIREAVRLGVPILGICRGIQILNVAFGGSLIQDIPTQVKGACQHFQKAEGAVFLHHVDVEPQSVLARVLGAAKLPVNSYHHQAIDRLGAGLKITGRASDGVVEGVESSEGKAILAVQWHPEAAAGTSQPFHQLFKWIVDEAAIFSTRRR